jgi:mannose-6-phosphate isomerase
MPTDELRRERDRLKAWLVERAFPLWWEPGADQAGGGFHDRLDPTGRPIPGPKRARVQARQVFCYALAADFGWRGPWREAMDHGRAVLEDHFRRHDGLYRTRIDPPDDAADLYDHAFVLLADACLAAKGDAAAQGRASALLGWLPRDPAGGFAELAGEALYANPNMHLFEAFLAWTAVVGAGPWREAAAGQARLALTRLIDPAVGVVSEAFGPGWGAPAARARRVEPGHQFEWAWLLMRWSLISGDAGALSAGLRLIELGERAGVDPDRDVAINALDGDLRPIDTAARLWPQTERLRANLLAGALTGAELCWDMALSALKGLDRFLDAPTPGLWCDSLESGDLTAPASSLYHIVGAVLQLDRVVEGRL